MQVWNTHGSPDETDIGNRVNNGVRRSFFLLRLPTNATDPAKNDAVHAVRADCKNEHGKITHAGVESCATDHETGDSNQLGYSDVPRPLIEPT
jgi:hypothetical protein